MRVAAKMQARELIAYSITAFDQGRASIPARSDKRRTKRDASVEPSRVTIVMQVREVLEVYHAHPPVGRFSFRHLVGVYGSGPFHNQDERYAEGIRRLSTTRLQRILPVVILESLVCGRVTAFITAVSEAGPRRR